MPVEAYKTDDLALAVMLSNAGFRYAIELLTEETALWCFSIPDDRSEQFDNLVADYETFEATVEPRKFVAKWATMRRELFKVVPPASGRRSASAA
jgi:hypothetical protein